MTMHDSWGSSRFGGREHGQTMILDRNLSSHRLDLLLDDGGASVSKKDQGEPGVDEEKGLLPPSPPRFVFPDQTTHLLRSSSSFTRGSSYSNGPVPPVISEEEFCVRDDDKYTIRFQVVVWYVGVVDVVQGQVPITFRVTMFWNDPGPGEQQDEPLTMDAESVASKKSIRKWQMLGRQQAVEREVIKDSASIKSLEVPPISILNVVTFDTIGSPDVSMLREDTRLMRWSCMYRATLIQNNMRVDRFPHDMHDISIKLGILAHRNKGRTWDRTIWKLALATERDSQGSTRVPHGLVVDQVSVPDFSYDKEKGLSFEFVPLEHGLFGRSGGDQCLEVKLSIQRSSGYYDNNIMPILALLNTVAISVLWVDASMFYQRALLLLNITFVEISIRMSVDKLLPSVGYQIKMQRVLNGLFCGILCLVLESGVVHALHHYHGWSLGQCNSIDRLAGALSVILISTSVARYYSDLYKANKSNKSV